MLSHLSLGSSDLGRSEEFYAAALGALGFAQVWKDATALGYGLPGGGDKLAIKLRAESDHPLAAGPGFHIAFNAPSKKAVQAFHAAALANGGSDDGAPGLRAHYGPNYYAAFVTDPDGHKLEAVYK